MNGKQDEEEGWACVYDKWSRWKERRDDILWETIKTQRPNMNYKPRASVCVHAGGWVRVHVCVYVCKPSE